MEHEIEKKTFKASDVKEINIKGDIGKIEVEKIQDPENIEVEFRRSIESPFKVEIFDKKFEVHFDASLSDSAELDIDYSGGSILLKTLDGIDLNIKTRVGPIEVRDISTRCKIESNVGPLKVANANNGNFDIDLDVGPIDLKNISGGAYKVKTKLGPIDAGFTGSLDMVDLSIKTGPMNVDMSNIKSGSYSFTSGLGPINIKFTGENDITIESEGSNKWIDKLLNKEQSTETRRIGKGTAVLTVSSGLGLIDIDTSEVNTTVTKEERVVVQKRELGQEVEQLEAEKKPDVKSGVKSSMKDILDRLERGEITSDEAVDLLGRIKKD